MEEGSISKPVAVIACTGMAVFYVAILYSPTLVLRLPPPTSLNNFMIRRFICALVSSIASIILCSHLLSWCAMVFPLSLTSLLYAGSFVSKCLFLMSARKEDELCEACSFECFKITFQRFLDWIHSTASNVLAWRNYVVAPLTEELVFRACMIPLLLCGGFKTYSVVFLSPIFFSLAHLNHFSELYCQQNYPFSKAAQTVGLQLGYTVIFGWYASFLFIRTGHLLASIVAHIFCNMMGLPILLSSRGKGVTITASVAGLAGFLWLLFPATKPELYNNRTDNCRCWHDYCSWSSS
ncbi:farnesylated protein-converting enzyme 2 isoform X2 [Tasmannia lanceolata]|uniref:farnesylated protein-converting enzyme 2 isoform X2 n=1 Tax=Tasmannia lanceolata TaxID=3420 RepID=UPI0040644C12